MNRGQRFNDLLLPIATITTDSLCGAGLPSLDYQDPKAIAADPTYCSHDDGDGECHYYTGGFDVEVHERMIGMNGLRWSLMVCI
eukprot:CAMPEP_0178930420 /NCGR_PEP_ID=MMETSP0786-20121207/21209_1 /TAXON_ID=186022 /ORGANISM="Thalassionema frauenfeldii, Strain CCMP 1798" /LENGTH=83 /DNA_ID=CAMNT_0020606913 /DNA_START=431 /DNA_END=682 /DNA_ORIENTATION=+